MSQTFAFFIAIFVGIDANLIPNNFVQINKFALANDELSVKVNKFESLKNILINNFIVTSDNLKAILNFERENEQPKDVQSLSNKNSLDIQSLLKEDDFNNNNDQNENSFDLQSLLSESNLNGVKQKMEDVQPKKFSKRQIGGGGGDDGNSQVVLGTFQAIMRPMSMPGLGNLGNGGQSVQNQNENVEESQDDKKNQESNKK